MIHHRKFADDSVRFLLINIDSLLLRQVRELNIFILGSNWCLKFVLYLCVQSILMVLTLGYALLV